MESGQLDALRYALALMRNRLNVEAPLNRRIIKGYIATLEALDRDLMTICITCQQPILVTDEWSWLDGKRREPEHDTCYSERFARQFPTATKVG